MGGGDSQSVGRGLRGSRVAAHWPRAHSLPGRLLLGCMPSMLLVLRARVAAVLQHPRAPAAHLCLQRILALPSLFSRTLRRRRFGCDPSLGTLESGAEVGLVDVELGDALGVVFAHPLELNDGLVG